LGIELRPYAKGRFFFDQAHAQATSTDSGEVVSPLHRTCGNGKKTAKLLANAPTTRSRALSCSPIIGHATGCSIKGKIAKRAQITGDRGIYHLEGCRSYRSLTTPNRWFCTEEDARAADIVRHLIADGPIGACGGVSAVVKPLSR